MKIAVTTQGDEIFQHFGQCATFTVFTVKNDEILQKTLLDADGNGHGALSGYLKQNGVDTLICGGIGEGAKNMLHSANIKLISGVQGNIDAAIGAYLSGNLADQDGSCDHGDHEEHHDCSCADHN